MAGGTRVADIIGMRDDQVINKACSFAMKDHKPPAKPYILEKSRGSPDTYFFIFPGSWLVSDWFAQKPFGETKINRSGNPPKFPSLRSIGNDEVATVNDAFLRRFEEKILGASDFKEKVLWQQLACSRLFCSILRGMLFSSISQSSHAMSKNKK